MKKQINIALAGNPNTGKSTLFNTLTGLKQHTGNWTGKTVDLAAGTFFYKDVDYTLIDLPGTYSLLSTSPDEEVARDYILFEKPAITLVIVDATALSRNLNLALQVLEITKNVIVCVNLIDEAEKKGIIIDTKKLASQLGVPVIPMSARNKIGIDDLLSTIHQMQQNELTTNPFQLVYTTDIEEKIKTISPIIEEIIGSDYSTRFITMRLLENNTSFIQTLKERLQDTSRNIAEAQLAATTEMISETFEDDVVTTIHKKSQLLAHDVVEKKKTTHEIRYEKLDKIVTSPIWGFPIMLGMLGILFYITIAGANVPSSMLADMFNNIEGYITDGFQYLHAPEWLHGLLVLGLYRSTAWVISVMLPPMAIFFPVFALLENFGFLPRVAFNMDRLFKGAGAHGKQSLTMAMGFGCNAAAVMSTRIIESPRERMLAILTNNFVPCNGRWPTLILLSSLFMASSFSSDTQTFVTAAIVIGMVLIGIIVTLVVSWSLSKTLLKGIPTHYTLELPPYRKPLFWDTVLRASIDRSLAVLKRAIYIAAPAGVVTWIFGNIMIGDTSILAHMAAFLDPFANTLGLDGYILMAFILGLPANEIVIPILLMGYLSSGALTDLDPTSIKQLFLAHNWTWLTALNMMLFSLLHYPCGTTLINIYKETKSKKWTFLSFLIPTCIAIGVTFLVTQIIRGFGIL